jgi:hypothetical protein
MGALIEGIMESVADWYSQNLAAEVAKGKNERSNQGMHSNQAPFGMMKDENKVLFPHPDELPGLLLAFREYASGRYSDNDVAGLLNDAGYKSKTGRPFSKETVRSMLQIRTCLGQIKYQKYERRSDGRRSFDSPVQWFDGRHQAVVDEELFDACEAVRASRRTHRQATKRFRHYLLRNIVYCHRCIKNPPEGKTFRNFGKMRCQTQWGGEQLYYRCRSTELGYDCDQLGVPVEIADAQVVTILKSLEVPDDWRKGVTRAVGELLGEKNLEDRLAEIRDIIKRMDIRWDHGFFADEQEYLEQRLRLQQEMEKLTPVPDDELQRAADMLENFGDCWENLEGDENGRHELVKLIVERVYMDEDAVVEMTLKSNCHFVLGHNANGPTEYTVDPSLYACGSDGDGALTCKTTAVMFLPRYIHQDCLSSIFSSTGILPHSKPAYQTSISA